MEAGEIIKEEGTEEGEVEEAEAGVEAGEEGRDEGCSKRYPLFMQHGNTIRTTEVGSDNTILLARLCRVFTSLKRL